MPRLLLILIAVSLSGCSPSEVDEPGSEPMRPAQEQGSKIPLAEMFALVDAENDAAWRTEEFGEMAGAKLAVLAKALNDQAEELETVSAPGFRGTPLFLPAETLFSDRAFEVTRAESYPEPVATALPELLGAFAAHMGGEIRTKFKITRIQPGTSSYGATVRAGFSTADREVNAIWQTEWIASELGEPRLLSIKLEDFEEVKRVTGSPLFSDCTEAVLSHNDSYQNQLVYGAPHWHGNLDLAFGIFQGNQGLAIGDANGDGLDDLYLCQPDGLPNRLFLAQPDGTLMDHTEASGLGILDISRSPLFIDVDNDGDQDLALSHRFSVSFFENLGNASFKLRGTFTADSRSSGISAADYDADGDLDVYLCGYTPQSQTSPEDIFANPVPYEDARNGGFNYLLRNDGGFQFSNATPGSGLDENNTQFSFAASWEDFDNDGDQDLYVANDFGRNNLYRNGGDGTFTDVAGELGVLDIGAGMSVDWGDPNRDGRMDLYVSNMWSSAGNRIAFLDQFKRGADKQTRAKLQRHARGNSLFLNGEDGFADQSLAAGVNMGRWAWGSLFVDFNNDGWEDIYIANGFMSSPEPGDL